MGVNVGKINYTWEDVKKIRKYPHLLGLLAGKDKLTLLHSYWIRTLFDSKKEIVFMAHRGAYKTTSIEIGIIYYLAFHPNARVALIRKSYTKAAESVRNIANMMLIPEIKAFLEFVWGTDWKFTMRREGKLDLSVKKTYTKEVSLTAKGIDSAITGDHYDFAVADDCEDLKDRVSEAEREKTILVMNEFRSNILDRGCHMVFVGTPWHRKGLYSTLPPAIKFPIHTTGLISPEEEADIRNKTTPTLFAINYKLEFENDEDMLFKDPYIGKWRGKELKNIRAHVDAAFDGDHYCALTIMGKTPEGKLNAVGFVYQGNIKDWFAEIAKKLVLYGCNRLYIEDNADKGYSADVLKLNPVMKENHIWVNVYHEKTNKDTKIATYLGEVWKDIEWAEETDSLYLEQCMDWRPKSLPDDAPDSAASLVREGNFSVTKTWDSNLWRW